MQAYNHYIIVDKIKEAPRKVGDFELPGVDPTSDVRYLKGKVINFGINVQGLKEGNIVYYDKHAGHGVPSENGGLLYVIRMQDVVIVEE